MKKRPYEVILLVYVIASCIFLGFSGFLVAEKKIVVKGIVSVVKDISEYHRGKDNYRR